MEQQTKQLVRMKLRQETIAGVEAMAEASGRHFHNQLEIALRWAIWSHTNGREPEAEMAEVERLRKLYELE